MKTLTLGMIGQDSALDKPETWIRAGIPDDADGSHQLIAFSYTGTSEEIMTKVASAVASMLLFMEKMRGEIPEDDNTFHRQRYEQIIAAATKQPTIT